jgi:hypothetical protein
VLRRHAAAAAAAGRRSALRVAAVVRRQYRVAAAAAAAAWLALLVAELLFAPPLGAPVGEPDLPEKRKKNVLSIFSRFFCFVKKRNGTFYLFVCMYITFDIFSPFQSSLENFLLQVRSAEK